MLSQAVEMAKLQMVQKQINTSRVRKQQVLLLQPPRDRNDANYQAAASSIAGNRLH